ncbi:MAG: hypothetical protein ACRDNF_16735, partial [Streptosporangiaceae bacterium]
NNLKDVNVEIPKRRMTVFTGVAGSGKSSLLHGSLCYLPGPPEGDAGSLSAYCSWRDKAN